MIKYFYKGVVLQFSIWFKSYRKPLMLITGWTLPVLNFSKILETKKRNKKNYQKTSKNKNVKKK